MLARDLGCPDVDRMLAQMGARQLSEWAAFYSLEAKEQEQAQLQAVANAKLKQRRAR